MKQEKSGFFWMELVSEDGMVAVGAIGNLLCEIKLS